MFDKSLIYDVGMHDGDDTAAYLEKGYSLIAVEADPDKVKQAEKRFSDFIKQDKLKILNIGVSAEEGEFEFYINETNPEWNSFDLSIASRDGLPWHAIKVKTVSFDKIIGKYGVPYYLKVDIEGHDYLCIEALEKDNLPRFMSVEVNDRKLIYDLAEKGFTRFKIIFQHNLAHLDLPPNKYFKRWLLGYKLRQWNSFPVKVFRKLIGKKFFPWFDRYSLPPYNRQYKKGTSGNFGDDLGGKWYDLGKTIEIHDHYHTLFHQLPNKKDYAFWIDVHASW